MTHNQFVGHVVGTCIWIPQELDLLNAYTLIWIHKNCEIYYLAATELWHHILWLHIITCMFLWLHHVHISTVTPNLLNEHKKCFVTYKLYTQSISNNAVSPIPMQCRPQSNRLDPTKLVWLGLDGVVFSSFYSFSAIGFIWFVFGLWTVDQTID